MKKKNSVVLKMDKDDFDKVSTLLPDICPDVDFTLKVQDDNLVALGFCDSAPCLVKFDLNSEEFEEMLMELNEIEVAAFAVLDRRERDHPDYHKYLKYGCLYEILFCSERIYQTIGKVKYVGKTFGIESLTDGRVYRCIDIEPPFIRVIDDSGEDYLYSITEPGALENPELCGKWVIVEDETGALAKFIKETERKHE